LLRRLLLKADAASTLPPARSWGATASVRYGVPVADVLST
jgi:hypothetical protein